jgi:ABC-type phosphate transport system substrate-binding protein
MKHSALGALILAILVVTQVRAEEIVVIVNPAAAPISKEQLADLYLARDSAQIKAIWARILFTGRGVPPKQLPDSEAVKKAVAANPKAVGYIEKSAVDASVKVALPLN